MNKVIGQLEATKEKDIVEKFWLPLSIVSITLVIFAITSIRYMSFLGLNWDLGINMQMLWTNQHGYLLFETADHMTSGVLSFLQVNSVYIAIPLSYIYSILPEPFFLLFFQAVIISASAVPLFYYSNLKFYNHKISLLITVLFISNFAVLSGVFYDFHWESILPLEFFTFIYLYSKGKYWLSLILVIIGSMTLEVFPFLVASYLIYPLIFPADNHSIPADEVLTHSNRLRAVSFAIILLTGMTYYLFAYIGGAVIPSLVGAEGSTSTGSAIHAVSYLFNVGINPGSLLNSLEYWVLLFSSLGFLSLYKIKSAIVLIPWVYWSVFAYPLYTAQFGLQYGIIALLLLMVPTVNSLSKIKFEHLSGKETKIWPFIIGPIAIIAISMAFFTTGVFTNHSNLMLLTTLLTISGVITLLCLIGKPISKRLGTLRVSRFDLNQKISILLFFMIIVGLLLGPINPVNTSPPYTGGYAVSFSPSPSYGYMSQVEEMVGHNNTVISTDNLFPFVANNPYAYSFYWYLTNYSANKYFPYSQYNLPKFLLLDTSEMFTVPSNFKVDAFSSNLYGLREEIVNSNYPGDIYLFELGYHSKPIIYITK